MSLEKEKNSSVFSKRLILLVSGFIVTFFLVHLASPRSFSERIESYEYYKSWSFNLVIVLGFLFSFDWSFYKIFQKYQEDKQRAIASSLLVAVMLILVFPLAIIYYLFVQGWDLSGSIFHTDIPVSLMLVLLFGAGFFSYYYFKSITLIEKEVRINTIPVIKGHQNVMLNVDEVSFIYLVENMTWVVTKNNTEYHSTKKLKELELDLEGLDFFRVNRQLLASKHSIKSYGKAEHRKLAIHLNDKNESTYLLSKEKVTKFKNWLA